MYIVTNAFFVGRKNPLPRNLERNSEKEKKREKIRRENKKKGKKKKKKGKIRRKREENEKSSGNIKISSDICTILHVCFQIDCLPGCHW